MINHNITKYSVKEITDCVRLEFFVFSVATIDSTLLNCRVTCSVFHALLSFFSVPSDGGDVVFGRAMFEVDGDK